MQVGQMDIRGARATQGPASFAQRLGALAVDLTWITLVYFFYVRSLGGSPFLRDFAWVGLSILLLAFYLFQRLAFHGTLGMLLWDLQTPHRWQGLFEAPIVTERQSEGRRRTSLTVSLISIIFSLFLVRFTVFTHPLFLAADEEAIPFYAPPKASQDNWTPLAFHYTLGAWPKHFSTHLSLTNQDGRAILYALPYEKGPPSNFTGRMLARWEMPDIQVTTEGPKTAIALDDFATYRKCLTEWRSLSWSGFFNCASVREKTLSRHIGEMKDRGMGEFELHWFEVKNAHIPPHEWARGIHLRGKSRRKIQDRMILFTPNGAHQTILLDRSTDERGNLAWQLFQQTVGTLRVTSELRDGRALVDRKLSKTTLRSTSPDALIEIQALLLSKISVDPKNYDAYYHLGGTSSLLLKKAKELRGTPEAQNDPFYQGRLNEWATVGKVNLRSAYLYAKDLQPENPKTDELQALWLEVQKQ